MELKTLQRYEKKMSYANILAEGFGEFGIFYISLQPKTTKITNSYENEKLFFDGSFTDNCLSNSPKRFLGRVGDC
jgi:hypothetical protein